jgi:transposase InsO family protein
MDPKRQAAALFRYSLVRELADPELSARQRGALIRSVVAVDHAGPDGRRVAVSAPTLRRWLRAWRAGGFEALAPAVARQPTRTPAQVLERAETLKREAPKRTAAQVSRALAEAGVGKVSARTLQRHFARLGLTTSPDGRPPRALGRFETTGFGELWTGDALHGPTVGGRKAILFAFIDDWSRAVPGWRWGHSEDTVRLEAALRRGVESRGVPQACFVDNGSAFVSAPFHRSLAVLGARIVHSTPGHAASRGKIERFFGTVRRAFLVELEARGGAAGLAELNELFGAWVEGVYHRSRHSETGETPLARLRRASPLRRPTPAELHEAFLWAETRVVTKTASVSLFGNHYEVDPALVGAKVELAFDPFDLTDIDVRYQGRAMGRAVPRRIGRHTHPAATPEVTPPAKPSGIDYLLLVAARVAAEEARRIGYAAFTPHAEPETGEPPQGATTHWPPAWDLDTDTPIDDADDQEAPS